MADRLEAFIRSGEVAILALDDSRVLGLVTVHVTPVLHRPTCVGRITAIDPLTLPPTIPNGVGGALAVPASTVRLLQRSARTALDRNPARP